MRRNCFNMKCNFKRLLSNRVKKFSKIRNFLARPCKCGRLTTTSISWDCVWLNFTSRYSVVTNCYFMQVVWRNFFFRWKIEKIFFFLSLTGTLRNMFKEPELRLRPKDLLLSQVAKNENLLLWVFFSFLSSLNFIEFFLYF